MFIFYANHCVDYWKVRNSHLCSLNFKMTINYDIARGCSLICSYFAKTL